MSSEEWLTIEKKTMEEALLEAEGALGVARDAMEIKVIREAKKGLFGLADYNAIIHVKAKETKAVDVPEEALAEANEIVLADGSVQIIDGKAIVIDPDSEGLAATITPGENVHIVVNGQLIDELTEVYSKDEIALIPVQTEPGWEADLRVTGDRLEAYLKVIKTQGYRFFISNARPKREVIIHAKMEEAIEPKISLEELRNLLREKNIFYGILENGLIEAIDSPGIEMLVARGDLPKQGKDASVKVMYLEEKAGIDGEEDEEKIMERVARHAVISVEPGQLLAEVVPPIKGRPGKDIYGQIIEPKPVKELILIAGKGAEIDQEGQRAFASIYGRPEVVKNRVSVHPTYTVTGDVTAKVGRILFKGDVQVTGNVLDEMVIDATGKIVINGYTANATIVAGGDVVIRKNVIGGVIRAGGLATICGKAMVVLEEIQNQLPLLLSGAKQLLAHPSFAENKDLAKVGHGIIFKMLLSGKFQQLLLKLQEASRDLDEIKNQLDYLNFEAFLKEHAKLQELLTGNNVLVLKTMEQAGNSFDNYSYHLSELLNYFKDKTMDKANLVVTTVQNSHLECSGEIKIMGQGAYNCNIYAGGDVVIQGMPGIFRGGEIVSGGNVVIRELGSPAEISSKVKINTGKSLKAQKIYPKVIVEAGARTERITYEQSAYVLIGE